MVQIKVQCHNQNIALVNQSLPILGGYGIKHIAYIELYHETNKALVLSNVTGLIEVFHNLGRFSDNFYLSIQKAQSHVARTFLWPSNPIDDVGLSLKAMGLSNGMTIIQKDAYSIKTWAFIGDNDDSNLADSFINERDIFYNFIPVFQEKIINCDNYHSTDYIPFKSMGHAATSEVHSQKYRPLSTHRNIRYYLHGKYSDVYITNKEKICMSLLACNRTYKEIAGNMSISSNTVKKHIDAVKLKTGILRKSELIKTLISMGVVSSGQYILDL